MEKTETEAGKRLVKGAKVSGPSWECGAAEGVEAEEEEEAQAEEEGEATESGPNRGYGVAEEEEEATRRGPKEEFEKEEAA